MLMYANFLNTVFLIKKNLFISQKIGFYANPDTALYLTRFNAVFHHLALFIVCYGPRENGPVSKKHLFLVLLTKQFRFLSI